MPRVSEYSMRLLSPALALVLLLHALAAPAYPASRPLVELSLIDTDSGRDLPAWTWSERRYVAGEIGRRYAIRIRNHGPQRLLAVTSVDGVNVLNGKTAHPGQPGYVIESYGEIRITGWRKSLESVAAFHFAAVGDSYAERTGRPQNRGVVGIAVFREKTRPSPPWSPPCCGWRPGEEAGRAGLEDAASARSWAVPPPSAVEPRSKASAPIGTGHGERIGAPAREVAFERAATTPDVSLRLYYDSRANLQARGILPPVPEPFPASGFVPDP